MMAELHETMYGKKLLEGDIPQIKEALQKIAKELKRIADMSENTYLEGDQSFIMTQRAYEGKLIRILNTISSCTAEDQADVIDAIKKDEIKWDKK